ncbi:cytochrome P450 [Streptomyces sp. NBC_01565]|uniref:cytochrome P450 n=1 Tax=unclassified Streptomyces TaxID=2593676 RepID=UPI0022501D14|nr:cytochrome P450 [Streptomyces sp. NBC_01565]MCX4539381.1 cytochrome P450 [Streptomyces sp. NBC_01565]
MSYPVIDSTVSLWAHGYAWLPDLRRRRGGHGGPVRTRLLGRRAVVLHGPADIGFFYDERHVLRHDALPGPVLNTLFGRGAVHTLDGAAHRARKAMFVSLLMTRDGVAALVDRVETHWREAFTRARGREIVLFDQAATVLAEAVCDWAGLPVPQDAAREIGEDCVAMVDGFATAGPRHWKARRARARQEEALARTVTEVRAGVAHLGAFALTGGPGACAGAGPAYSALETVAHHRDADGRQLDPHTAAVELLNIIRPTVAIAWFAAFAAHALERNPDLRDRLRADDGPYARAFAHEVRRFYPFVPFVGGLAAHDLEHRGQTIPEGTLVLLDVYGHHHDPGLFDRPYRFDPTRFLGREPDAHGLIPQGGGDARTGHRCPGEDIVVGVLAALVTGLGRLDYTVPEQDLTIPLRRVPTRPRSGFVLKPSN